MTDLEALVAMSRYAGERFDLVQAGGGNSSVKREDGTMLIKASGRTLSEVDHKKGYVSVRTRDAAALAEDEEIISIRDKGEREALAIRKLQSLAPGSERPSVETFLHALLSRYTLHTHPLLVNAVTCRAEWDIQLRKLFGNRATYVPYRTPGFALARELKLAVTEYESSHGRKPEIVFLQNHGLIVSSNVLDQVFELTDSITTLIEKAEGVDLSRYRITNSISALIRKTGTWPVTAYLSCDADLLRLIRTRRDLFDCLPFCPDSLVYCGMKPLVIGDSRDPKPFEQYRQEHGESPRVVLFGDQLLFVGANLRKAREVEEMFKFHLMALELGGNNVRCLDDAELRYLHSWEAERYRQKK